MQYFHLANRSSGVLLVTCFAAFLVIAALIFPADAHAREVFVTQTKRGGEVLCIKTARKILPAMRVKGKVVSMKRRINILRRKGGIFEKRAEALAAREARRLKMCQHGFNFRFTGPSTVSSGEKLRLQFNPGKGRSFSSTILLMQSGQILQAVESPAREFPEGAPFNFEYDTLNLEAGTYVLSASSFKRRGGLFTRVTPFSLRFEVLSADAQGVKRAEADMISADRPFALYSKTGELIGAENITARQAIEPGEIYLAAVNLSRLPVVTGTIEIDFSSLREDTPDKSYLIRMRILKDSPMPYMGSTFISTSPVCGATVFPASEYQGVRVIKFRSPRHMKYYQYDGELVFRLATPGQFCVPEDISFSVPFNDSPAEPVIAPNTDQPLFTVDLKAVSFAHPAILNSSQARHQIKLLVEKFYEATKGYSALRFDGNLVNIPFVNGINEMSIRSWYASVPKTPGKQVLNLEHPDQLYIAALQYYSAHPALLERDLIQAAGLRVRKNELLAILTPQLQDLGVVTRARDGFLVNYGDLYPVDMFADYSGGTTTYHLDFSTPYGISSLQQWFALQADRYVNGVNTMLHELGHVYWEDRQRGGVSRGDLKAELLPFESSFIIRDESIGFFSHRELMSYGRDRMQLDGVTYGDSFLERILSANGRLFR